MTGPRSPQRQPVTTALAPAPAGTYSQAIAYDGLVFVAGQTPRTPDGARLGAQPFEAQVRRTLENLAAVATAAGTSLRHALKVTVYLRDPRRAADFDAIYREYVQAPPPARTCVQSDLPGFEIEVDAVLEGGPIA